MKIWKRDRMLPWCGWLSTKELLKFLSPQERRVYWSEHAAMNFKARKPRRSRRSDRVWLNGRKVPRKVRGPQRHYR